MDKNKEWIFSGVGVAVLIWIIEILRRKRHTFVQKQKSGSNSSNIQAGRDVKISAKEVSRHEKETDSENR